MTLEELNAAESAIAKGNLLRCCGSQRWAAAMTARRPFGSISDLHTAAQEAWSSLGPSDWLEAFACHPKIGGTRSVSNWSAQEQKGMGAAGVATIREIETLNHEYQDRFGYIFIVCASGKSAVEMCDLLKERLRNDSDMELQIASEEQMKITQIRLDKLIER